MYHIKPHLGILATEPFHANYWTVESIWYTHKRFERHQHCEVHRLFSAKQLPYIHTHALVQSAGFSVKTQPRLLLLPISFHGLTTATVSSWVHLILSSNLSRKFRTLLQDLFSWHRVTTTQCLSAMASYFRTY